MADTFNETATALVLHKQSIPPADLVRWQPEQLDEQQRDWYFKAYAEGVILQINLAIRTLGTHPVQVRLAPSVTSTIQVEVSAKA